MDKTVKIRSFSEDTKGKAPQSNLTEDQDKFLELAKKMRNSKRKRSLPSS